LIIDRSPAGEGHIELSYRGKETKGREVQLGKYGISVGEEISGEI